MSSKVENSRVAKPVRRARKTEQKDSLLSVILQNAITMPSCSFCEGRGILSCQVSAQDSSRCAECVRLGRSRCDVQGVTPEGLRRLGQQHQRMESELEAAEEERRAIDAKIERLRKQKRMWYEKMMRAVRRGIDNVEELERVENEEVEAERKRIAEQSAEVVRGGSPGSGGMEVQESWLRAGGDVGVFDWSSMVNEGVDWSEFGMVGPSVGGGNENVSAGGPSGR